MVRNILKSPFFCVFISVFFAWSLAGCGKETAGIRNTPVVKVIREWAPSVVNISTEKTVLLQANPNYKQFGNFFDDFYKDYFLKTQSTMKLKGVGSGVIVSGSGLIVTNAHVVNMASKVYVVMHDGATYEATLAAINPKSDLALLKINSADKLKPVKLADDVMIGETVVAIGNPLGLENSVSVGVISGLGRKITTQPTGQVVFDGLIQTDASINIGSSGGALLNLEGRLVGINIAVVQGAQSLGFAVSYDKIKSILKDYEDYFRKKK
ncbi:MAG TPA: trypsin-like peptidase domain-containing protein [Candidatus Omnitrophota bacterium]|nr:trypsin-like peptidase domain-containing protein [Candidatus Omnitrophota bacterium]